VISKVRTACHYTHLPKGCDIIFIYSP